MVEVENNQEVGNEVKQVTIPESMLEDLITQAALLQKIYQDIVKDKQMSFVHKKILLKNKKDNDRVLAEVEKFCKTL